MFNNRPKTLLYIFDYLYFVFFLKIIDFFMSQNGMFRHVGYKTTTPELVKLKKKEL